MPEFLNTHVGLELKFPDLHAGLGLDEAITCQSITCWDDVTIPEDLSRWVAQDEESFVEQKKFLKDLAQAIFGITSYPGYPGAGYEYEDYAPCLEQLQVEVESAIQLINAMSKRLFYFADGDVELLTSNDKIQTLRPIFEHNKQRIQSLFELRELLITVNHGIPAKMQRIVLPDLSGRALRKQIKPTMDEIFDELSKRSYFLPAEEITPIAMRMACDFNTLLFHRIGLTITDAVIFHGENNAFRIKDRDRIAMASGYATSSIDDVDRVASVYSTNHKLRPLAVSPEHPFMLFFLLQGKSDRIVRPALPAHIGAAAFKNPSGYSGFTALVHVMCEPAGDGWIYRIIDMPEKYVGIQSHCVRQPDEHSHLDWF